MIVKIPAGGGYSNTYNLVRPGCVSEQEQNCALAPPKCPNNSVDQWACCGASVGETDANAIYAYVTCRYEDRTQCPADCRGIIRLASAKKIGL